jgi:hypothetical protein
MGTRRRSLPATCEGIVIKIPEGTLRLLRKQAGRILHAKGDKLSFYAVQSFLQTCKNDRVELDEYGCLLVNGHSEEAAVQMNATKWDLLLLDIEHQVGAVGNVTITHVQPRAYPCA